MKIKEAFLAFIKSNWQLKLFYFNVALYIGALIWTTLQAYARLEYSRSDYKKPIIIQVHEDDTKK
jgi:hypothetical protein